MGRCAVGASPGRSDFERELGRRWAQAQDARAPYVDVASGDLHRAVGGYPGPQHRMPMCCSVMYAALAPGDEVLEAPPKGNGARLMIRYRLPRGAAQAARAEAERPSTPVAVDRPGRESDAPPAVADVHPAGAPPSQQRESAVRPPAAGPAGRIGLVGCVKKKQPQAAPAADLYVSALFRGRRACIERTCGRWFILSALHGLVRPDVLLEPYDYTLNDAAREQRRAWSAKVLSQLEAELGPLAGLTFEIHAGANYTDCGLIAGLRARGAEVEMPASGLRLGEQLAFYAESSNAAEA